jgi:hypothetical protein
MAHDDVNEVFPKCFGRKQAGVPATVDDRHFGMSAAYHLAALHGIADHGAGQERNTEAEAIFYFSGNTSTVVGLKSAVDDTGVVSGFPKRSCEAQQTERRPKDLTGVRREEENHLAGGVS